MVRNQKDLSTLHTAVLDHKQYKDMIENQEQKIEKRDQSVSSAG